MVLAAVGWLIGSDFDPQLIPFNISDGLLGYRANGFGFNGLMGLY